jgi:segregation and condensation protein B
MASEQENQPDESDQGASVPQSVDDSYIPTQQVDGDASSNPQSASSSPAAAGDPQSDNPQSDDPQLDDAQVAAAVEAILFATDSPLTLARVAQVAQVPQRAVKAAIAALNERYRQAHCAFAIEEIAGGFQMLTLPQFHDVLSRLLKARSDSKLSQPAMETLSIVAYRQPILRADIESIRGVASGEMLRGLMERQLVKIVGRAEVVGRPMLYGTTKRFLEVFGLAGLEDLPRVEELRAPNKPATPPTPTAPPAPTGTPSTGADAVSDPPSAPDLPAGNIP